MTAPPEPTTPGRREGKAAARMAGVAPFLLFLALYLLCPRFASDQQITLLIYIGINALLAIGLNLLMGYAGQISLGHAAFYGLGAYTSAILTTRPLQTEVIPGISLGLGVIGGTVVFLSMAKPTGARLGGFVVLAAASAAAASAMGMRVLLLIPVLIAAGALYAAATKCDRTSGAAGALAAAVTTLVAGGFLGRTLERGSASPWVAMASGLLVSGAVAYLVGAQVLRLRGHYLAMATLGFGIIVEIVFRQWTSVTGGSSDGIFGIPTIDPFARSHAMASGARLFAGRELSAEISYFYLVWAFVFLALLLAVNMVRSRVGRAFQAVHGSELAAESLGVDTGRYKVQVFVVSAALSSLAGSLHAQQAGVGYINPSEFGFDVSVQMLVMVVVGGMASVWGALLGATAIQMVRNWLLGLEKTDTHLFGLALQGLEPVVFGAMLILVMILMPKGLVRGTADSLAAALKLGKMARGKNKPT